LLQSARDVSIKLRIYTTCLDTAVLYLNHQGEQLQILLIMQTTQANNSQVKINYNLKVTHKSENKTLTGYFVDCLKLYR